MQSSLSQTLYISYSNQKARDIKNFTAKALDRVITLDSFILELFESKHFETIIDATIGISIIYKIIQTQKIHYFDYLEEGALSLQTIYDFLIKCKRNEVAFEKLHSGEKLEALRAIDRAYEAYKTTYNLVDIADIEKSVSESWNNSFVEKYKSIILDSFRIGGISYIESLFQERILQKIVPFATPIKRTSTISTSIKLIKPSNEVFDNIDEVKTALRITRKLLEEGVNSEEILIVASDIQEYVPLYKLFLAEYGLKGYSSIGTPLSSFHTIENPQVQTVLSQYKSQVAQLTALYKKLGLTLTQNTKDALKNSFTVLDKKIGIEMTEPNQIVGLTQTYKHIIFLGTDINHFPPKASDNFLYSYDDALKYFYSNNYFTSSQTQLEELKRLTENLYIITASYSGKRELTPSILISNEFDETIDISSIKSLSQLALENKTVIPDTQMQEYYKSITGTELTKYDGLNVEGVEATHLSASQINKYISCPLAYLYSNKVKVRAPNQDEEGFDVMEQGSLMHLCYEHFGRYIKDNHIKSTNREELYEIMYKISIEAYNHENTLKNRAEENIHHQIFLSSLQAGLKDDRNLGLLAKFVEYYIEQAPKLNYFQDTEFEKEFALDGNLQPHVLKDKEDTSYFIRGFIDRFDNLDTHINVIDYKSKKISTVTGKDTKTQEKIDTLKDVQLALYLLFTKQQYRDKKHYAAMLSFKAESKAAHFGVLDDEGFNNDYAEKLKNIIYDTKKSIESGEFGFDNSDAKMCEWCDIKYICHQGVLNKKG